MSSHSARNAVNRNLDEQMPISSPAPTEVAAPLREESVAEGNVHEEAEDRELEPPVAASQDVRSGVLTEAQKNSYLACLGSFFGVSKTTLSFIDDLCQVVGGRTDVSVSRATSLLEAELFPQYEYTKLCFCSACDSILSSSHALCWNEACEMNGVYPKISKNVRRTAGTSAGSSASSEDRCVAKCAPPHPLGLDKSVHDSSMEFSVQMPPLHLHPAADYEYFLSDSLKTARVDMNNVKSSQTSVRQLSQSSDSVVRRLTSAVQTMSNTIAGVETIIDGLQMSLEK
ncbi:hypothetical protein ANCCAN_05494 [Ancylostoma caninum]|uniref:Uncharacterized protein n=1 Tax=Ancylostoma caninum TaxID=29170 RepID=A0A368GY47_ANCCA|nr:hypothetical protein ANCCAN_05494 [Ancylostoma caninum]